RRARRRCRLWRRYRRGRSSGTASSCGRGRRRPQACRPGRSPHPPAPPRSPPRQMTPCRVRELTTGDPLSPKYPVDPGQGRPPAACAGSWEASG
ncbi:MAG: hypothetical protein ACK53Y_23690, partial [bacterium]